MKIGLLTLGKQVPSTRFRFEAMLPYLKERGHQIRMWTCWPSVYEYFPTIGWRLSSLVKRSTRWRQWLDALWFQPDCIYLERGVYHDDSVVMDQRFRRRTKRLVLDVDDGIFLEFPNKIPRLIEMSDHVVVATPSIAEYVSRYTDGWTLIPTSVDMNRYSPKPPANNERPPVVGWIGTAPNVAFLEVVTPALRALARDVNFELLVVANHDEKLRQLDLSGVNVRFETWSPEQEVAHLHRMDVGIMPLPADREWMRYKAATKLVQYLAVGIPAVASPIGVNADILQDGRAGFAATTSDQWIDALRILLKDQTLRETMGSQGRELVARQFSIQANAPRLEKVLTA